MVKFVARQSIDSEKLTAPGTDIKVVFKKSSTSVIATRDGKYYTIDGMNTPNKSKTLDLLKNADKLFKGSDTLIGSEFGDTLKGFDKSDKIKGQAGDDTIVGGNGPDTLFGQGGDDNISGGRGDDWLYGGSGSNLLSGGAGNNNFVFDAALNGKNISTISDFKIFGDEDGVDQIGLDKKIFKDLMTKGSDVLFPSKLFRVGEDTSKLEDHSLIYDKSTGVISYTSNGSIADSIAFCKIQSDVDYLSAINFIFV